MLKASIKRNFPHNHKKHVSVKYRYFHSFGSTPPPSPLSKVIWIFIGEGRIIAKPISTLLFWTIFTNFPLSKHPKVCFFPSRNCVCSCASETLFSRGLFSGILVKAMVGAGENSFDCYGGKAFIFTVDWVGEFISAHKLFILFYLG